MSGAYFAKKRRKGGKEELLDSSGGESEQDRAAYSLIMKEKERLLSFEEPVSFLFSHSALREGWDNPNVFQICTLNQTTSELKKRQEIGRGLRLVVNQDGQRLRMSGSTCSPSWRTRAMRITSRRFKRKSRRTSATRKRRSCG